MRIFHLRRLIAATTYASLLLGACGGDNGDNTTTVPQLSVEGAFSGSFTGSKNGQAFRLIILENGEMWMFYGTQAAPALYVGGLIQGQVTQNNGSLSSTNTVDFGAMAAIPGSTTASYEMNTSSISGAFSSPALGYHSPFVGTSSNSLYNYATAPSLPTIQGTWTTSTIRGRAVTLQITPSGDISGSSTSDCNFAGRIVPRPSLKNVFNVSLQLGPAPCGSPGEIASGVVVAYPLADGQMEILLAFVNSTRTWGWALSGRR